jgi:enediyne biosynthesis protein E4
VADVDGDGHEDVFLSQNFFAFRREEDRCEAGRGLWLRGDGHGKLIAVPGNVSGVKCYGEQRGAAVADFDHDGRVDLAVTQNGSVTRLFHNVAGKPGLRVKLVGPDSNPDGFGAVLRLRHGSGYGPAREVHGGSGYWSQDSPVQVLGFGQTPTELSVRWPGGKVSNVPITAEMRDVTVRYNETGEGLP